MDESQRYTEVVVHEAGHALVATHFGAQLKELSAIPTETSAGNCMFSIAFGTSQDDHDTIAAAGRAASEMWNSRYGARWDKQTIRDGAGSDWSGIKGSPFEAQKRAQKILADNWDELHGWVGRLHSEGRIVDGIWEMDRGNS